MDPLEPGRQRPDAGAADRSTTHAQRVVAAAVTRLRTAGPLPPAKRATPDRDDGGAHDVPEAD
jgi:hypothetical protein